MSHLTGPKGFRITRVHCCYTCVNSIHEEGSVSCELMTSPAEWLKEKHYHPNISPIGICDECRMRKGIAEGNDYRGDNIK